MLSQGLKLFRQWVTYYAKDRFIKHNTGEVNERSYYKDFKEFFEGSQVVDEDGDISHGDVAELWITSAR